MDNYSLIQKGNELFLQVYDDFDLSLIFDCGQCFRFDPVVRNDIEGFEGVAFSKFIRIEKQDDGYLLIGTTKEDFCTYWLDFFDLSANYRDIRSKITSIDSCSDFLKDVSERGKGIRILKQDKWETLCSFIVSQNNNIPRIKKLISALCEKFGDKIETPYGIMHAFPKPETLFEAGVESIGDIRCGFRAKYIYDAAKKIVEKTINLEDAEKMSLDKAAEYLMQIKGVGPKVAYCTLLFGYNMLNAFPVDVWIKKVSEKYFDSKLPDFGEYGGIVQQYLFYYERYQPDLAC